MSSQATLLPPRSRAAPAEADGIESSLALGLALAGRYETFAASLALSELGDIELPPEAESPADQASLQAVAPLYLASELEAAGLLPAVELVVGLFASGGLNVGGGPAADRLAAFWQARRDRFAPAERRAFFARMFGGGGASLAAEGGSNRAFLPHMIDLTEALYQWEGHPLWAQRPGPREETRVRTAARQLAANLLPRSGGMVAFAARDILLTVKDALEILKDPAVQSLLGARSVWGAVRGIRQRYRMSPTDNLTTHVSRGQAGQTVLAWLAGVLPKLEYYNVPVLSPGDGVIFASARWLQATLTLAEAPPAGATPGG